MQQYPPQQQPQWQPHPTYQPLPQQQQPGPAPKVRGKRRLPIGWIIALVIVFGIGFAAGSASHSGGSAATTDTTQATAGPSGTHAPTRAATTPTAAHVATWTTTHTFSGNGSKKTDTFTAPGDWKILWTCDPASFSADYNVIVSVTGSDNTPIDPATINTLCKAGNTSGSTEERQGGSVFLDVTSEGAWTLVVQELK